MMALDKRSGSSSKQQQQKGKLDQGIATVHVKRRATPANTDGTGGVGAGEAPRTCRAHAQPRPPTTGASTGAQAREANSRPVQAKRKKPIALSWRRWPAALPVPARPFQAGGPPWISGRGLRSEKIELVEPIYTGRLRLPFWAKCLVAPFILIILLSVTCAL